MANIRPEQEGAADFAAPRPSSPRDQGEQKRVTTPARSAQSKDEFARRNGFTSYLDLFEASTRTASTDRNWFVTPLRGGGWIVWNDVDLAASSIFPAAEDARRHAVEKAKKSP